MHDDVISTVKGSWVSFVIVNCKVPDAITDDWIIDESLRAVNSVWDLVISGVSALAA